MMPYDPTRISAGTLLALLALVPLGSGCGEPTGSVGATLVVTASTTGIEPDLDGYAILVDDQAGRRLARNATLTVPDLEPGAHRIKLDDFAPNCSVDGENPRSLDLVAGATVTVTFHVACPAATGAIALHTITTGEGRDPDGYAVVIDGQGSRSLATNGSTAVSGLAPGDHTVDLEDVITNCQLVGEATRTVTVEAGAVAELTYSVACVARTLHISVGTTGRDPDPDGYAVAVDRNTPQAIAIAGSLDVGGLVDGPHTVALTGLAPFCATPDNPRMVQLSETSTSVNFDVQCPGPPVAGRILFNGVAGGKVHVFVMRADGTGRTDLTPNSDGRSAEWSPDRARIVFETTRNSASEIFVMNADGSHPTRLAAGSSPSWSPDGEQIAFIAGGDLRVINADGSHPRVLPTGTDPDQPAWSPDGRRIAYTQINTGRCDVLIPIAVICARDVYTVNADGSGGQRLTLAPDGSTWSTAPVWSPDGATIAFARSTFWAADSDLFLMAPDGTHLFQLTNSPAVEGYPVWSPDGRALAFSQRSGTDDYDIALISRQGGTPIPLLIQSGEQVATSWW